MVSKGLFRSFTAAVIVVVGLSLASSVAAQDDTTTSAEEPTTTAEPTTEAPTTEEPTTEAPTTEAPTTTEAGGEGEGGSSEISTGPWILMLVAAALVAILVGVMAGSRARRNARADQWTTRTATLLEQAGNVAMHAVSAAGDGSRSYDAERLNALIARADELAQQAGSGQQRQVIQPVREAMAELAVAMGADDNAVAMRANLLHQSISSARVGLARL